MKRIFISGPMTDLPELNYPAFHAEAGRLRALGYHVENPAENPAPRCGTWEGWMRLSLAQLLTCDGVVTLPNWVQSRGAPIEVRTAYDLAMPVMASTELVAPPEAAA